MTRLIIHPQIHHDECPVSYLIRICELNGFKSISHLLQYGRLKWKNGRAPTHQILTGQFNIKPHFNSLGLKYIKPRTAKIFETSRSSDFTVRLFVRSPKICPHCVSEIGYCSDLWSLISYTTCLKHKTLLIDEDPSTKTNLSWYRPSLSSEKFHNLPKNNVSPESLELTEVIAKLIQGIPLSPDKPDIIRGLKFPEALSIIQFIAHFQYRMTNSKLFTPATLSNQIINYYYTDAWTTLKHWPDSFYEFLNKYIENPMSEKGTTGINKHFRDINERLYDQRSNKGIKRIRTEFTKYIDKQWPNSLPSDKLTRLNLIPERREFICLKEAQRILGCRPERIKKLINRNLIEPHIFKGHTCFKRQQIKDISNTYKINWSMAQTENETQLSRYLLKQLLDTNQIECIQHADKDNRDWLIDKSAWINQIDTFKSLAKKHNINEGISLCGLQKNGFSISEVFRLIKARKLEFNFKHSPKQPYSFRQLKNFQLS